MNYGNDIGYLGNNPGSISVSNNAPVKHTQVYYATHRDNGARSSFMNRSFISFSFGGKWIEDFNLIACINGDRLNKQLHANFNDLTSEYEVVNGQFYWGTYYTNNQISFTLATDGITQNQLDEFKNWFAPGQVRELVLSEHPNRAIMARVMEPPVMDIIPFEEETTVMVNTKEYKTSTTVYKGEFTLNLVMDEPFWHSKSNLLTTISSINELKELIKKNGTIVSEDTVNDYKIITYISNIDGSSKTIRAPIYNTEIWADIWSNSNDNIVPVLEDKDALKVILEDGIPTLSMLRGIMTLGNGLVFSYIDSNARVGNAIVNKALVGDTRKAIADYTQSIAFNPGVSSPRFLYYAGTAPELPTISFVLPRTKANDSTVIGVNPITSVHSSIAAHYTASKQEFDSIYFICDKTQELKIQAPLLFNDYNRAFSYFFNGLSIDEARKKGRDELTHPSLRKWFFKILDTKERGIDFDLLNALKYFIISPSSDYFLNSPQFSFNFKTGEMLGTFTYRIIDKDIKINSEDDFKTLGTTRTIVEDISDMIISKPVILDQKNILDENGVLQQWRENNKLLSYKIYHNFPTHLMGFSVTYQNKYY